MSRHFNPTRIRARRRRGSITVLAAFLLVVFMGMLVFAIDLGYMQVVRCQAQAAADSAALAAAWEMIDEESLSNDFHDSTVNARKVAGEYAGYHRVGTRDVQLLPAEDVAFGRMDAVGNDEDDNDGSRSLNAVTVTVRATSARGHASPHFFARFFGHREFDISASATAVFGDKVSGFRGSERVPNTTLLPFTLQVNDWESLASHVNQGSIQDQWAFHAASGTVMRGRDGIPEINLFPISNGAGNWGTIDVGSTNNSTQDLKRQIREGVSCADLDYLGGSLELDPHSKSVTLNGDTGISEGMTAALQSIIGDPRTIPLFESASGNGDNMNYKIVGFAGMRVMDVKLTGQNKYIRIQPAFVVDKTAVSNSWATRSDHVLQRVHLVK